MQYFKEMSPGLQLLTTAGTAGATIVGSFRNRVTRAVLLSFSRYPKRMHSSARVSEVEELAFALRALEYTEERFIIMYGPKGVGKSTALASALQNRRGVIRLSVSQNLKASELVNAIQVRLWPYKTVSKDVSVAAQTVIDTYRRLCGPPVVILDLANDLRTFDPADAVGAARVLSRSGMLVVIDISEGTLQVETATFSRARRVYVDYMPWDELLKFPQLQHLFKTLEQFHLTTITKEIVGGCPGQLENLADFISKSSSPEQTKQVCSSPSMFLIYNI
eukprot:TRINITY_DN1934_c0_g1_i3.p1 TRINITY_DN1934_c0_g1~~TRINITY_DN1934_c0_g1_i3.p1  ORF type:complete len:285 (+),score=14.81 TRINITY_DN1934_c0_g1_i3:26-856(+)